MKRNRGNGPREKASSDPASAKTPTQPEPGGGPKIGPGNPPPEYRWQKGFCPNPSGRPRKKVVEMGIPNLANPMHRKIIEHASRVVGEFNGEPVTRLERTLMNLEVHAHEKPELAKTLLQLYSEAHRESEMTDHLVLKEAIAYKDAMEPVFRRASDAGRPPPPIYPHPDDVIVGRGVKVTIDGPVTAQEARELETILQFRDALFLVVEELMDWIGDVITVEEGRRYYESIRRKFYRFHRRIPRRLYEPFPKFRTTPRKEPDDLE